MDKSLEYAKMCEKAEEIQREFKWSHGDTIYIKDNTGFKIKGIFLVIDEDFVFQYEGGVDFTKEPCFEIAGINDEYADTHYLKNTQVVWLPRQNQLQEIYKQSLSEDTRDSSNVWIVAIDDFHDWIFEKLPKISFTPFVSMEQLWLAFVMKENYHKSWDGNNWVSPTQ